MRKLVRPTSFAVATAALATVFPASAAAATPKLVASVGPDYTISLRTTTGAPVRSAKAGVSTIVVRDRSDEHNFRLVGPGVNKATGVDFMGSATWRVRLLKGKTYRFVCDPHASHMHGSFRLR